jgi:DNA-binding SARP family transcriptional activator
VTRLTLLGGFEARLASGASLRLPSRKAQALLAYLGIRPGQEHSRDKLASLLWGNKSDEQARGDLRHALLALRRALAGAEPAPLRVEGQDLALDAGAVEVDVATFERRLAEGTPAALEQAAALYRGDLLAGFDVDEPLFEEWLVAERERLREAALDGLARLLAHQAQSAGTESAIQTAVRLLALDPLQEAVHRTLMRLYARQGRRGAALKQYQLCVGALRRELGTEPEPDTKRLYQELLRRPAAPAREPAPPPDLATAETPLFGRQGELDRLRRLLEGAGRGQGHVVTVVGEAGIGKTRLVSALMADALAAGSRVLIGRCHESDAILPFGPWVDALRSAEVSADEATLAALHPVRRAELARLLPEAGVAGLPRASDGARPLFESVAALVEQLAARQPLVLALEDVHWADEMSLRLLAFVSRRILAWPALLLVTAREEELADAAVARRTLEELSREASTVPMVLAPLSQADTARLARALTRVGSDAATLAQVQAQVWALSEGNPFVAVEVVRALDQESPEAPAVPARVRDLVAQRLDRLGPRGQELAALAAVIGRRFDFALLSAAGGAGDRETAEAVEEMVRRRVLQAVGNELDFTHERVRDVAYGRLLPPRRQLLHRAVAEALERTGGSRERIEQLAHHAQHGDLREKAVQYLRQAGTRAAARSALREACAWFERALDCLEKLPETRGTVEEAFEIRLELQMALGQLGEFQRALAVVRKTEALAEQLDDDACRARVQVALTHIHARLEDTDQAIASGQRVLQIAGRLEDPVLRALATSYLGLAHYYRGEYTRVVELTTASLAALPPDRMLDFFGGSQPLSVNSHFRLLASLAQLGRFTEAAEHETEIVRLAEATQHPYAMGLAYHAASLPHLARGTWARARDLIDRQLAAWRAGGMVWEIPMTLAYAARVLAHLGDAAGALSRLEEAEQLLAERADGGRRGYGSTHASLGRAALLLGRLDDAQRFADRAAASASGRSDFVPATLRLLGDIASHPDRLDAARAESRYRQALALAEPRGMRPLVAHCHLGLGTLRARTGRCRQAAEHLDTAAAMYRDMGMVCFLARAEAESTSLQG